MKKEKYITFRPRIYLPQKYADLVSLFKKRIHKKTVVSVFIEKVLDNILKDKESKEWEEIIKEIIHAESLTSLNFIHEEKQEEKDSNSCKTEDHTEDHKTKAEVSLTLDDILI